MSGPRLIYPEDPPGDWLETTCLADIPARQARRPAAEVPPSPEPPPPEGPPEGDMPARDIAERLSQRSMSDTGNAKRLIARHGSDLIFVPEAGWHIWDGRRFERDDAGKTVIAAQDTARLIFDECRYLTDKDAQDARAKWGIRSQDRNRVSAMLSMAEPHLARRHDDLDADMRLLNCMNGTVDLRTAKLRPHRRQDLITRLAPVEYDPSAQCPTWIHFLEDIFGANPDADPAGSAAHDLISFVQRAVGYAATGSTAEHVLFVCWGGGRNGKSTLLNTLAAVLGDYASNAAADTFLVKDRGAGGIPNDIARLAGARFVTAIESGSGRRLDESLVKQVTGADTVTARFLHREFFEYRPQFKLWLATNHRPDVRGTDRAIWSRIILIPFKQTFFKADDPDKPAGAKIVDKDMEAKLRREAPGIFRWAVEGALDWQRQGLNPPAAVQAAVREYRAEQDVVGEFIKSRCILGDGVRERASTLFARYTEWAAANAAPALTAQTFGRRLGERGLKRIVAGNRFWQGIELKPEFKGQMI